LEQQAFFVFGLSPSFHQRWFGHSHSGRTQAHTGRMADQDDDLGAFLLDIKAAKKHFGHSIVRSVDATSRLAL